MWQRQKRRIARPAISFQSRKIQRASFLRLIHPPADRDGSTACSPASKYPESITRWCSLIEKSAEENGLAVDLIAALMLEESGGDPLAYSASGAVGLLQVMPRDGLAEAFQCINGPCFASRPSTGELQDPAFNLGYGARLLKGLWNRTGDLREGLKAYGPIGVEYAYADAVLAILETYQ